MLNKRDALKRLFGMAAAPAVLSKDDIKSILASGSGRAELGIGSAMSVVATPVEEPPHILRARHELHGIMAARERRNNAGVKAAKGHRPEISSKRSWSPVFKAHCIEQDDAEFNAVMEARWSDDFLEKVAAALGLKA